MKKILILSAALCVFAAPAFAGIDVAWNACPSNGGASNITLDCADAGAQATLLGQVQSPSAITGFVNMDCIIDIQVDAAVLTDFADFQDPVVNPAGCNPGWTFGDERPTGVCAAASATLWGAFPAGGQATAIAGFEKGTGGANRGRFRTSTFRSSTAPINVVGGTNYFGFKMDIFAALATEAGGPCSGCPIPIQIVWNEASMGSLSSTTGVEAAPVIITNPGTGSNQATTQGGGGIPGGATPTQNKSWGALKSLYR